MEKAKRSLCFFDYKRFLFADLLNTNTHDYGDRELRDELYFNAVEGKHDADLVV